ICIHDEPFAGANYVERVWLRIANERDFAAAKTVCVHDIGPFECLVGSDHTALVLIFDAGHIAASIKNLLAHRHNAPSRRASTCRSQVKHGGAIQRTWGKGATRLL